jgi:hypothetical protein
MNIRLGLHITCTFSILLYTGRCQLHLPCIPHTQFSLMYIRHFFCGLKNDIYVYSNWYYLLLLAFACNSFVFLILDNISTSVWLWIQVSSGQRGQFVLHHGCLSELLGPHPPRLTTLFPVLSSRTPGCSH